VEPKRGLDLPPMCSQACNAHWDGGSAFLVVDMPVTPDRPHPEKLWTGGHTSERAFGPACRGARDGTMTSRPTPTIIYWLRSWTVQRPAAATGCRAASIDLPGVRTRRSMALTACGALPPRLASTGHNTRATLPFAPSASVANCTRHARRSRAQ